MINRNDTVLSIQSHVVYGCVGNKCAVFPLQLSGLQVDTINTVQFSNHTGYPVVKGDKLNEDQIDQLIQGLSANGLLDHYDYLLTGYIGNPAILNKVRDLVKLLKSRNDHFKFIMDPVMGDNDYLYISEKAVPIYRDELLQYADMITPNAFELKLLTGLDNMADEATVIKALDMIHEKGVSLVILTSVEFPAVPGHLHLYASLKEDNKVNRLCITFLKYDYNFTGTGDLLAALLLGNLHSMSPSSSFVTLESLQSACEAAIASMQSVLESTVQRILQIQDFESLPREQKMRLRELRVVQNRKHIEHPIIKYKARLF